MQVYKVVGGLVQANTYIITANGVDAVVVDPGEDGEAIVNTLNENGLNCRAILITHAHFDHCNSAKLLKTEYGAKIYMHKKEVLLVESVYNLASKFGKAFNGFNADVFVKDGQSFELFGLKVTVLHTPGHTVGSCCYIVDNMLFSGDTLFNLSIGRTDFPTGNAAHMKKSLQKLFKLNTDYTVFAGHGISTKLFYERDNNPYA